MFYSNVCLFVAVTFPFILLGNLLNMPAGVVPVTQVNQDDLNALSDLDDNDLGITEIKQVKCYPKDVFTGSMEITEISMLCLLPCLAPSLSRYRLWTTQLNFGCRLEQYWFISDASPASYIVISLVRQWTLVQ